MPDELEALPVTSNVRARQHVVDEALRVLDIAESDLLARYEIPPRRIEENSAIMDVTRGFIRYMHDSESIPVLRALMTGRIRENEKARRIYETILSILKEKMRVYLEAALGAGERHG